MLQNLTHAQQMTKHPGDPGNTHVKPILSSRDSDSGCSADMSQSTSTTDSWATSGIHGVWHKGKVDNTRSIADCVSQNHNPDICRQNLKATRSIPNDYVHLQRKRSAIYHPNCCPDELIQEPAWSNSESNYHNGCISPRRVSQKSYVNDAYQSDAETNSKLNNIQIYSTGSMNMEPVEPSIHASTDPGHIWRHTTHVPGSRDPGRTHPNAVYHTSTSSTNHVTRAHGPARMDPDTLTNSTTPRTYSESYSGQGMYTRHVQGVSK